MNKKIKIFIFAIFSGVLLGVFAVPFFASAEIYVLSGQNFYSYDTRTNTWATRASFPVATGAGRSLVYPGSGDYIYALRGKNNTAFYRYNIRTDPATTTWESSWGGKTATQLVAPGVIGAGGSLVYPGTPGYIYALAGGGTRKYYKFTISSNTWSTLSNLPNTISAGGSSCTPWLYAGSYNKYVYFAKGGNTNVMYYTADTTTGTVAWNSITVPANVNSGSIACAGGAVFSYSKDSANAKYFGSSIGSWTQLTTPAIDIDRMITYYGGVSSSYYIYAVVAGSTNFYRYPLVGANPSWQQVAGSIPGSITSDSAMAIVYTSPGAPTNLTVTKYEPYHSMMLSWTKPNDYGGSSSLVGYKIERQTPVGAWTTIATTTDGAATVYFDSDIVDGQDYNYRISAINTLGVGGLSNVASFSYTAPSAPTGLSAAYSSGQINLSWTAPTNNGGASITGYKIERQNLDGSWSTFVANTGNVNTNYQYTGLGYVPVLGVDSGSTADWTCSGYNGGSRSGQCTAIRAPLLLTANNPKMVSNYCYAPTMGLLTFSWTYYDSDGNLETKYQFQIDDSSNFDSPLINRIITKSNPSGTKNSQTVIISLNPLADQLPYNVSKTKIYYWRAKVYNDLGVVSDWKIGENFTTEPHPWPNVDFTYVPLSPRVNQNVVFTDQSICYASNTGDGAYYFCKAENPVTETPNNYYWDFGDGVSNTVGNNYHVYTSAKTVNTKLKICDENGCCDKSESITIRGTTLPEWREISPF